MGDVSALTVEALGINVNFHICRALRGEVIY